MVHGDRQLFIWVEQDRRSCISRNAHFDLSIDQGRLHGGVAGISPNIQRRAEYPYIKATDVDDKRMLPVMLHVEESFSLQ